MGIPHDVAACQAYWRRVGNEVSDHEECLLGAQAKFNLASAPFCCFLNVLALVFGKSCSVIDELQISKEHWPHSILKMAREFFLTVTGLREVLGPIIENRHSRPFWQRTSRICGLSVAPLLTGYTPAGSS